MTQPNSIVAIIYKRPGLETVYLVAERLTGTFKGKVCFLGGKIDPGETPTDCLHREVYEESYLRIHTYRRLGTGRFFPLSDGTIAVTQIFVVSAWMGQLEQREPETNGPWQWLTRQEISQRPECDLALAVLDRQEEFMRIETV